MKTAQTADWDEHELNLDPALKPSWKLAEELLRTAAIAGILAVSLTCNVLGFGWFAWCGLVLLAIAVLGSAVHVDHAEPRENGCAARSASLIGYANLLAIFAAGAVTLATFGPFGLVLFLAGVYGVECLIEWCIPPRNTGPKS